MSSLLGCGCGPKLVAQVKTDMGRMAVEADSMVKQMQAGSDFFSCFRSAQGLPSPFQAPTTDTSYFLYRLNVGLVFLANSPRFLEL